VILARRNVTENKNVRSSNEHRVTALGNRCELDSSADRPQDSNTVRIICIGAHPDDCEIEFGGAAYQFAASGHDVKLLSVINGAVGHHVHPVAELAAIRKREAARRLGISETEIRSQFYQWLPWIDGQNVPCDLRRRASRQELDEIFPR
jgi:LmbE family N-acetylglucosaminyl deacetylase